MQYRTGKGNPAYPRLHDGWNIRYGYSTDGYYRKVYILLLHPVDDSCISFQSQYRTQILLGSGVAEGAAAYVVGTGFVVLQRACTSKATGSIVSTGVSFMRSCTQRQPPSRAMRAASRYEYRSV